MAASSRIRSQPSDARPVEATAGSLALLPAAMDDAAGPVVGGCPIIGDYPDSLLAEALQFPNVMPTVAVSDRIHAGAAT